MVSSTRIKSMGVPINDLISERVICPISSAPDHQTGVNSQFNLIFSKLCILITEELHLVKVIGEHCKAELFISDVLAPTRVIISNHRVSIKASHVLQK
jgi:hypothetical protein